jgi:hypothetical protein
VPPQDTVWQATCVVALQVNEPPPPQEPLAPLGPQPEQTLPTLSTLGFEQTSPPPHEPGTVKQPPVSEQADVQQTFVAPTAHAVSLDVQLHAAQLPAPSQRLVQSGG